MESARSIDARRGLKNSSFDKAFRVLIVWPVLAGLYYSLFMIVVFHTIPYMPSGWQLFGVSGLVGGLQEKRWHNTIGYTTVAIFTIAGIGLGIWADGGILMSGAI